MKSDRSCSCKIRISRNRLGRLKETLHRREAQIQAFLKGFDGYIYISSPDYRIEFANDRLKERVGRDVVGLFCYETIHNQGSICPWCVNDRVYEGQTVRREIYSSKDNSWYYMINVPVPAGNGDMSKLALLIDITEQKQIAEELRRHRDQLEDLVLARTVDWEIANDQLKKEIVERKKIEAALRESKRRMADIIDFLPVATFVIDQESRVIAWNRAIEEMTGIKAEDILGKSNYEYAKPFYGVRKPILIDAALNNKQPVEIEGYYLVEKNRESIAAETAEPRLHGKKAYLWGKATPLYDEEGRVTGAVESILDLTERRRMEAEMARLDQLNVVGEMAAGIAHEIRNPMTTVKGFLQLISKKSESSQYAGEFKLMIEELDRANSILNEYLSLARGQVVDAKKQNLNGIIEILQPLMISDALLVDKHINFQLGDVPDFSFDAQELRQLILNLVRNGLEAMKPGGMLTISTYVENYEVVLAVADQGEGIPQEKWDRIGTPFYTTKEKGTGLGLAVCYSIAGRHNAAISFTTGPNGTTFFVRFQPEC